MIAPMTAAQFVNDDPRTDLIDPIGASELAQNLRFLNGAPAVHVLEPLTGWAPYTHLVRVEDDDVGGYSLVRFADQEPPTIDLNDIANMTDDEFLALPIDPARVPPTATLTTNANTWNHIAADLLEYAFAREEEYAVVGAATRIQNATADLAWDAPVTIALLPAHPVVVATAKARGATNEEPTR